MPASICDPVSSALRLSLTADDSQSSSLLDSRLYSSAKSSLLSKIEFEESGDYQSNVLDGLKSKYVVIRPKKPVLETKLLKKDSVSGSQTSDGYKNGEEGLPKPKRLLFPLEKVQLGWQSAWAAGAGMQNVGNTCYLNSTLQALFHVPAFANWLVSEASHTEKCNQQEACVICGMRATLMATQKSGGAPIKPWQVYSKLRLICRHLTPGRQEDAHEFLRYLVEAMEKCYLSRIPNSDKLEQYSKETTPLNQILGGYLRSTVRCLACHHLSTTYQHFQDLLLDIRKHSTLDEALDSFFSRERLEDLGYKCEACNKKVSATKQFFVERAPAVLCVALKRFSLAGGKLSKHVQFRKKISLAKYMHNNSNTSNHQLSYKLVSLVTHLGPSQNCGHYTAIGQAPNHNYYQFDDSCVRPLPLSAVLATNAYIMFFERDCAPDDAPAHPAHPAHPAPSTSSAVYGPQLPDHALNGEKNPIKLPFYRGNERKSSSTSTEPENRPIILNGTLRSDASRAPSEPWVVKQNGDVEKLTKVANGDKHRDDEKKISFVIKRANGEESRPKHSDGRALVAHPPRAERAACAASKLVKQKSPLEKLEEQMHLGCGRLVPYDSESSSDERAPPAPAPAPAPAAPAPAPAPAAPPQPSRSDGLVVTTKGVHTWTVSNEKCGPLLSPSLNGITNIKKLKEEKERRSTEASPNTSVSSMSPLSDRSEPPAAPAPAPAPAAAPAPPAAAPAPPAPPAGPLETARHLQAQSHRGYGAPVASWNGTHSNMSRQVFEERREQRKRALDGADEMDRGRVKKVKRFHPHNSNNNNNNCHPHNPYAGNYNRFHNRPGPGPGPHYNPFQEKQNKPHWNGSGNGNGNFKYRGDRRPHHHFNKHHNKYKRFNNRYNNNNNHHYQRHH